MICVRTKRCVSAEIESPWISSCHRIRRGSVARSVRSRKAHSPLRRPSPRSPEAPAAGVKWRISTWDASRPASNQVERPATLHDVIPGLRRLELRPRRRSPWCERRKTAGECANESGVHAEPPYGLSTVRDILTFFFAEINYQQPAICDWISHLWMKRNWHFCNATGRHLRMMTNHAGQNRHHWTAARHGEPGRTVGHFRSFPE